MLFNALTFIVFEITYRVFSAFSHISLENILRKLLIAFDIFLITSAYDISFLIYIFLFSTLTYIYIYKKLKNVLIFSKYFA